MTVIVGKLSQQQAVVELVNTHLGSSVFSTGEIIVSDNSKSALDLDSSIRGTKTRAARLTMNKSGYAGLGSTYYQQANENKSALFYYDRLSLTTLDTLLGGSLSITIKGDKPTLIHQLLTEIGNVLGMKIPSNDITNGAISWTGDTAVVNLQATDGALLFEGALTVNVTYVLFEQGRILDGTNQTSISASSNCSYIARGITTKNGFLVSSGGALKEFNSNTGTFTNLFNISSYAGLSGYISCVVSDDGLFLYVYNGNNTLHRYEFSTTTWTQISTNPRSTGTTRNAVALTFYKGKIYVYGGYETIFRRALDVYDIEANTWTTLTDSPVGRAYVQPVTIGTRIYYAGGTITGETDGSVSLQAFDLITNQWITLQDIPISTAGGSCGACNFKGRLYVFGGRNANVLSGIAMYDPLTSQWSTIGSIPTLTGRDQCFAYAKGDNVYLVYNSNDQIFPVR